MPTVFAHEPFGITAFGLVLETALAVAYVTAAARPSPRGNRWPQSRTVCFVAGLTLLAVTVQSPLADQDTVPWFHSVQHLVVMMVVPPLLVLGSPLTLLLRSVSPNARREIVAVLRDPAMKSVSGRVAGIGLTVEYYGTMFLVMVTPLYKLSLEHDAVHIAVHAYLLTCGLLFWMPLVGRDPAGWRPSGRARTAMVALGVPAYLALGLLVLARDEPLGGLGSLAATHAAGWTVGAGGLLLTAAGLVLLRVSARERRRARATAGTPA